MRTLFVFLSIVPLIISGCAASKSSLPEERNAKTGRSDNSAKRYNTLTVSIEFHSGASTQPQGGCSSCQRSPRWAEQPIKVG